MDNEETTHQLFYAIRDDSIEQAAAALDTGVDIEAECGYGFEILKPLALAAWHACLEIAALLLDRGAQVDGADRHGRTALLCASAKGHLEVAELLVSRGASLELADEDGCTPLLKALSSGKHEMATWLLDQGARMDVVMPGGQTVLHLAVGSGYPDFARLLQDANVAAMVDAAQAWRGWTALHYAVWGGRRDHVWLLLAAGASVDVTDKQQCTPLHLACQEGRVEWVRELLQRGARVNAVDKGGSSPLMLCSNRQAAWFLLESGADASLRNGEGKTARDLAAARRDAGVVKVLDSYFPQMEQVLLGLRGPTASPLTRFAQHSAFEPKVLSIVAAFHSGNGTPAFEQLQREAAKQGHGGDEASSTSSSSSNSASSSSSHASKKSRLS